MNAFSYLKVRVIFLRSVHLRRNFSILPTVVVFITFFCICSLCGISPLLSLFIYLSICLSHSLFIYLSIYLSLSNNLKPEVSLKLRQNSLRVPAWRPPVCHAATVTRGLITFNHAPPSFPAPRLPAHILALEIG